jgi:hypothetical protein
MKLSLTFLTSVFGHGYLVEPPGRSSYHVLAAENPEIDQSLVTPNYNHNGLFCGGFSTQIGNDYKCGVCGDNYSDFRPRENELGGRYGQTGLIPRTYQQGDLVDLKVKLTAHHKGFFSFKICPILDGQTTEDEACFNSDESQVSLENGDTKLDVTTKIESKNYLTTMVLPDDLYCDHCVLQWRYHTGNSWGCDDTGCDVGNGQQEEFYGCADIKIEQRSGTRPPTTQTTTKTTTKNTTTKNTTTTKTTSGDSSTLTPTTKITTTEFTTTESNDLENFCENKSAGLYTHPIDCGKFISCANGITYEMNCPGNLQFNSANMNCDWPANVNC